MHQRLAMAFLVSLSFTACSGGNGLSSGIAKAGDKNKGSSADGAAPSGDSAADPEGTKSTAPVQVSGAFLTAKCDLAASDEFAAVAEQDAYGCAIEHADGSKYGGVVQFNAIKVSYAKDQAVFAGLNPAPPTNRWHTYFYLPAAQRDQVMNYDLAGTLDSQRQFSLVYTPGAATSTGDIDPDPMSPAVCKPSLDLKTPPIYPFSMDALNAKSTAARMLAGTVGGSPIPVMDTDGGFKPGDKITGSFLGSGAVAIDKASGHADPLYIYACDHSGWKLYFQDANLNILNTADGDIGVWLKKGGIVPAGAVTATVGYSEPGAKSYKDNEGDLADLGVNALRPGSNGCNYTFHIERTCR